ncbi:hypothetical protein [Kitasatospora griseola]|uniref:hypothetical protein n=1 Tax=Kitasatospora griseola TaxID=2064 RepID=UPI00364EC827
MPDLQGTTCGACPAAAAVQWRRRNAADPTHTDAVYSCPQHAITLNAAAHVHQAGCPAPDPALLPACGCDPEPLPPPEPMGTETTTLPTGWVIPTT